MQKSKTVYLIASGDLRLTANQKCQPAQLAMEQSITAAFKKCGATIRRAHPTDRNGHCFIDSQTYGIQVFKNIPPTAPLIIAEAVWQYSHHVLPGLSTHKGPILTIANWSGQWPGLVGMLNLNGSMTKAQIPYATLWSEDFTDDAFLGNLRAWVKKGNSGIKHDLSHVRSLKKVKLPHKMMEIGRKYGKKLKNDKAIMGVFDEGCMGMFNAIIPDELLHPTGIFKERLSQSSLYAKMSTVTEAEARKVFEWYISKGVHFNFGSNEEADLTEGQVLGQCKMYIAAVRIAAEFGCSTIGIQYQQGLKDLTPASDLVEGTLNCSERPAVFSEDGRELFKGEALPHFNEVDECAGLDGLVTYELWKVLGFEGDNTLHDLRWGRHYKGEGRRADGSGPLDDYVWVFEISGAVPPTHLAGGWAGVTSERQPAMYFRLGGGTVKGVSKRGWIVWSRVFMEGGKLKFDTGIGEVVELPMEETEDRWNLTTKQWPIMHAILPGITRDQMMAKHKSNHIQVVYAPSKKDALKGMAAKAGAMEELGMVVSVCGELR